ncbi:hypothetical protein [Tenacibaculum xiamenense]|uniref:hypothetical protein n=1 Tax=Tenacibaculum xiamenense TaxID=1261553 RepID=UPI0038B5F2DF
MKTILQAITRITFLIFLSIFYISCSDSSEEMKEEPQAEPQGMTISFELNNEPITIDFKYPSSGGIGTSTHGIDGLPDAAVLGQFYRTYSNEKYELKLSFSQKFSQSGVSRQEMKEEIFSKDLYWMRYTDPTVAALENDLPMYTGFLIEITDKKNNKTYTSKVLPSLITNDADSQYEYNRYKSNTWFSFKRYEDVEVQLYNMKTRRSYIEAAFECKLIDYKIDQYSDEVTVNDLLKLTNGKILGLF